MTNIDVAALVEDIVRHDTWEIARFLKKYNIDYEVYNSLKYASLPCKTYFDYCRRYRNRIREFQAAIADPLKKCYDFALASRNTELMSLLSEIRQASNKLNESVEEE